MNPVLLVFVDRVLDRGFPIGHRDIATNVIPMALGQQLVVHARVVMARIQAHDETGVAFIQAENSSRTHFFGQRKHVRGPPAA